MTTPIKPRRQLGLFDATMIVMGGIVGAGIFANPSEVAHRVHTPFLILGVWVLGGVFAMWGAFIWAELATRLPETGGQYLYLRKAYHPAVAFVYGWGLLLVTQTGGMAAVAVIFASYFRALTGVGWNDSVIAAVVLLGLTGINCLGARAGSNVQSVFMLLRIAAIAGLVVFGFAVGGGSLKSAPLPAPPFSLAFWQVLAPRWFPLRLLMADGRPRLLLQVKCVMRAVIYRVDCSWEWLVLWPFTLPSISCACECLAHAGLNATTTPASDVMRSAIGPRGAQWIAAGIAISTLGFLSQSMLTAPRVYYAMARDGLFFASVGKLWQRSRAPVIAIMLQGLAAIVIACSGTYGQILNFEVTVDFIFFAMTAASLFILRRRQVGSDTVTFRVPGHPFTTTLFILACVGIVGSAIVASPPNSAIALGIMLAALPVYYYWRKFRRADS